MRLRVFSQRPISGAKVGIGLSKQSRIGGQFNRRLILDHGLSWLIVSLEVSPKIAAAHRVSGIDARRGGEMQLGLILFPFQNQRPTQGILGDKIILRYCERVTPKLS